MLSKKALQAPMFFHSVPQSRPVSPQCPPFILCFVLGLTYPWLIGSQERDQVRNISSHIEPSQASEYQPWLICLYLAFTNDCTKAGSDQTATSEIASSGSFSSMLSLQEKVKNRERPKTNML